MTGNPGARPDSPLSKDREDPSREHGRRRAALEIGLWRHRLAHPLDTLRTFASRVLPYRFRARLLRAFGRGRTGTTPTTADRESFFRSSTEPSEEKLSPRPTIICLPLVDWFLRVQRPHHLLTGLATRGWPVLYADLELGAGAKEIAVDPEPVAEAVQIITIPGKKPRRIVEEGFGNEDMECLARAFADLTRQQRIDQAIVLCHSPFWRPLAHRLKDELGWPVVYDRMDLHQGFSTTARQVAAEEQRLLEEADLVTATSGILGSFDGSEGFASLRLPNGCDPEHWLAAEPSDELRSLQGPVIGYFGAISDWFDTELVIELACARPTWSFVLIGSTWGADVARLEQLPNVHILGERSYDDLPSLAAAFDVGIIPFRRTPLIEATDPVKFYEMMALGLEVVAPPIPELAARGDLIHLAEGADAFLLKIESALKAPGQGAVIDRRQGFARANTWETRVDVLEGALVELFPLVSIGIVTFNNLELTRLCLESIERCTVHPNYEIVVVDNASEDGTREWLTEDSRRRERLRVVLNDVNRGFGTACNQAFAKARGDIFCFLNNDTVVTQGWLAPMVQALAAASEIGLVGPSSNGVANEARVDPGYSDLDGLHEWAGEFVARHAGESFSIPMLALYCAALRREVWEEIGGLDERFEIGLFEDDDFSRRVRGAGYDIRCLRDSWIHHFQEASFGALPREEYARIYEANRRRFREKWKGVR